MSGILWGVHRRCNSLVHQLYIERGQAATPVPGASVTHTFSLPDGSKLINMGITGDDGKVTFKLRSELIGLYESAITSISKTGWVYDPTSNTETGEMLTVP